MFDLEAQNKFQRRRETVFLLLAGLFLGSLAMLNILGLTKMINVHVGSWTFVLTMGVLPYPITFLCTDLISELYGRKRANTVVWIGLAINVWVVFIIWLGDSLPPHEAFYDAAGKLIIPETIHGMPNTKGVPSPGYIFNEVKTMTLAATFASMVAYLLAQFIDVHIFHYLKRLTKGKHLWLRNNGSTLISQLVDSIAVIFIAHYAADAFLLEMNPDAVTILWGYITAGYLFKLCSALLDTLPFYVGVKWLSKYLDIDPNES